MNGFTKTWRTLSASTVDSVLEFRFAGEHHWTHGPQMKRYIENVLTQESASGIVIDLIDYRYEFGNDLFGLFAVGFDRVARRIRPICILASGQTCVSLKSLLSAGNAGNAFDVSFVSTHAELAEWLHNKSGVSA